MRVIIPTLALYSCFQVSCQLVAQSSEKPRQPLTLEISGKPVSGWRSPDGESVVWVDHDGRDREIWVAKADGSSARNLTDNNDLDYSPDWSPDSSRIVFCSKRTGQHQIFSMDRTGGNLQQLTDSRYGSRMPRYSSGGHLAWQVMSGEQAKMPASALRVLVDGVDKFVIEKALINEFEWNRFGDTLAVGSASGLHFVNVESGDSTFAKNADIDTRLYAHAANNIQWAPDDQQIACKIGFLGGRMGGASIFGDDQWFVISPDGKAEVFDNLETARFSHDWIREN